MAIVIKWDVFLSYAHEDREVAVQLKEALSRQQLRVWIDDNLEIGDNLTKEINTALQSSRFGVVLVSPVSLKKPWTIRELGVLLARESQGQKCVLPILHNITPDDLSRSSNDLGNKVSLSTELGFDALAIRIAAVVHKDKRGLGLRVSASERGIGFLSGSFLIAVAVWLVFKYRNLTPPQFLAVSVLLALGAAGYAAILPGSLSLKSRRVLQATSSLAVFAIVLLLLVPRFVPDFPDDRKESKQVSNDQTVLPPQATRTDLNPTGPENKSPSSPTNKPVPEPRKKDPAPMNAPDLSEWEDFSSRETEAPRPFELRNAYCKKVLLYDGTSGAVKPVSAGQNIGVTTLHSRLWLVVNIDKTVSFVTDTGWGLAVSGTELRMQKASGPSLTDQFKFRSRLRHDPHGGPNYASGCDSVAIAYSGAARLLEPVSHPNHVVTWGDHGFELKAPPLAQIDTPQPFETDAIFILSFPKN